MGSPVAQNDMFAIESELEPIFDAICDGLGRFETLEPDLMVHFGSCGVIVRNIENDGLVRFEQAVCMDTSMVSQPSDR